MELRLSVHHIGGRTGTRAFPVLEKFEQDIVNVLYDADPDCVAQIQERNRHLHSELHVLPYCLGNTNGTMDFNINYDPYTSSLRELNPSYREFYNFLPYHCVDYVLSESCHIMEKRQVIVNTLDHIFASNDVSVPLPDFLSLDTQGSEYEILEGAKGILNTSVLALIIEVKFHPLYQEQKLFGDIAKFLSEQGFDFVAFLDMTNYSPFRYPIGLRGEGFNTEANALFMKRINKVDNESISQKIVMLSKLAFIAIVFNRFEYGLQGLQALKGLNHPRSIPGELSNLSYYKFLRELETQVEKMPSRFPETFIAKYSFRESKARFEKKNRDSRIITKLKEFVLLDVILFKKIPFLSLVNVMESVLVFLYKIARRYSWVESVMVKYGLKSQANILMRNRIIQSTLKSFYRFKIV